MRMDVATENHLTIRMRDIFGKVVPYSGQLEEFNLRPCTALNRA
jgi:hypothetical protein